MRTLFGRIIGHGPRGRPHKTWIEFTRDDLTRLSELQGVRGTYINWWVRCKDWKVWTMNIHEFKQTDNICRTGSAQAGVHSVWRAECLIINRLAGPERLMDDIVWRGGIVQRVSRLVLTWTCLRHTWHEALGCPVWIDCHIHMSVFRTDLSSYHKVVAKYT